MRRAQADDIASFKLSDCCPCLIRCEHSPHDIADGRRACRRQHAQHGKLRIVHDGPATLRQCRLDLCNHLDRALDVRRAVFLDRVTACPAVPCGSCAGTVLEPVATANFEPDVVVVYADAAQLRQLLMGVEWSGDAPLQADFDPIDSCAYAVVPALETGRYRITVPDPGEDARAAAADDEMIFSIPGGKLGGLAAALRRGEEMAQGMPWNDIEMRPDFPRPEFYDRIFRAWGLDTRD